MRNSYVNFKNLRQLNCPTSACFNHDGQKIIHPAAAEISPKVLRGASRCDDTLNPTTKYRPNPSPQLVGAPLYAPALPRGPPLHHLNCGPSNSTKCVFLSSFWAGLRLAPFKRQRIAATLFRSQQTIKRHSQHTKQGRVARRSCEGSSKASRRLLESSCRWR